MNYKFLTVLFALFIFFACKSNNNKKDKPVIVEIAGKNQQSITEAAPASETFSYELKKPDQSWKLPDQLVEVSGNTWVDATHLILIEDLHPNLYFIQLDDKNATLEKTIPFAEDDKDKIDIEDVTYVNNTVYALWSHGVIYKITDWQTKPQTEKIKTFLKKVNNTEGLCYDPVNQKLLIACKDESGIEGEKKSTKAVYPFDLTQDTLSDQPFLLIHKKDFEKVADGKLEFNPSAIAIHPVTHDIYLLSTKDNKCMAVYSYDGAIKSLQFIDKDLMPQPEGICFSADGKKLYISSEGKKGEPGNLFEFNAAAAK